MLDLGGSKHRERNRGAWPEDNIKSTIFLKDVTYSLRLETHRIQAVTHELLELFWA